MTYVDWHRPIIVSDGRPARLLATDLAGTDDHCVAAAVHEKPGWELIWYVRKDGTSMLRPPIVNVPKKYEKYEAMKLAAQDSVYIGKDAFYEPAAELNIEGFEIRLRKMGWRIEEAEIVDRVQAAHSKVGSEE